MIGFDRLFYGMIWKKYRRGWLPVFVLAALLQMALVSYRFPRQLREEPTRYRDQLLDSPEDWSRETHRLFAREIVDLETWNYSDWRHRSLF